MNLMDVEAVCVSECVGLYHLCSVSKKLLPTCLSFHYWYHSLYYWRYRSTVRTSHTVFSK